MTPGSRWIQTTGVWLGLLAAAGCHDARTTLAASAPAADHASGADIEPTVVLNQQMLSSISIETVQDREQARTLNVGGKVQFDEDRLARILAPLSGPIVGLHVKVGDIVRKGDFLCAISSREAATAASEDIESSKDLELAEKTASMTEDLFNHDGASKMALQQAQNELAKAEARVARSREALRVLGVTATVGNFNGRLPIIAPLAGVILERHVTDGQFVNADGTPIITIGDLSKVWVVGDVFEGDLRLVGTGQPAVVTTTAYPGEQFQGRVEYISDTIDPATRSAKVRVSVSNPGSRLKAEMFASIALTVSDHERVVTVPAPAIFAEDGRNYVYAEVADGRFVRRAITVGPDQGQYRRVISGLRAGDRVVVTGALLLRQEEEQRSSS